MSEELHEKSYTLALLGVNHDLTKLIGDAFGSPGTQSDLLFFNRLDNKNKCIFTAVSPLSYPEKIKSLIQVCIINRIHILIIDSEHGITPEIGEIIVVMDLFAQYYKKKYIAVIGNINDKTQWRVPEIESQLKKFISTMAIKDMPLFKLENKEDFETLKEKVAEMAKSQAPLNIEYGKVLIDHVFPVKGVGTVVLGLVQGAINAGEMYELIPVKEKAKKIVLRTIQKHDRDFKHAYEGDRVGLALKGVKSDEIDRNTILVEKDIMKISNKIDITLNVIPFFKPSKGKITPEDTTAFHIFSDLGITPVKIISGDEIAPGKSGKITISLEKGLPHDKNGLRGIMAFFSNFEGKLRIVGYFEMIQ